MRAQHALLGPCLALWRMGRFTPSTCDRHQRVWIRCGEHSAACNIIQHDCFHSWPGTNKKGGMHRPAGNGTDCHQVPG